MNLDVFVNLISTIGFPIACVIALGLFCWKMIDKLTTQQKEREDKLYEQIGECHQINNQAISTIAKYANSLNKIETDVSEIKTDVAVLMSKSKD